MIKIPPYLKKGDTIGITCPAGYMEAANANTCIHTLQKWGFDVMVGKTLGSKSKNYFSGTDTERANELQAMLDDSSIKAILFGRGGYGLSRIIDTLDFTVFKKHPKWLIGFSDITILHNHLNTKIKCASIHAPMAAAFNETPDKNIYIQSIKNVIQGKKINYSFDGHAFNKPGKITGELVGGNLAILSHLIGTSSSIDTRNKILFIEDVGEYTYNVDRMIVQLKRSGKLKNLAGLIIGQFSDMKDTTRPFGSFVYEVINEHLSEYNFPICYNFPIGHVKENYAVKCGMQYELTVQNKKGKLKEI